VVPAIIDKGAQAKNFIKRLETARRLNKVHIIKTLKEFNLPDLSELAVDILATKPKHAALANELSKSLRLRLWKIPNLMK
jgi:hypothetical protein